MSTTYLLAACFWRQESRRRRGDVARAARDAAVALDSSSVRDPPRRLWGTDSRTGTPGYTCTPVLVPAATGNRTLRTAVGPAGLMYVLYHD